MFLSLWRDVQVHIELLPVRWQVRHVQVVQVKIALFARREVQVQVQVARSREAASTKQRPRSRHQPAPSTIPLSTTQTHIWGIYACLWGIYVCPWGNYACGWGIYACLLGIYACLLVSFLFLTSASIDSTKPPKPIHIHVGIAFHIPAHQPNLTPLITSPRRNLTRFLANLTLKSSPG